MSADKLMQQNIGTWLFTWNNRYKYLLPTQFIEIMTILETLTDSDGGKRRYIPKPEFNTLRDTLIANLPTNLEPAIYEQFKKHISEMNTPRLRENLKSVIEEFWDVIDNRVNMNADELAALLLANRNAIAHGNPEPFKGVAKSIDALYQLNQIAVNLAWMALAVRVGLDKHLVMNVMREHVSQWPWQLEPANFHS